MTLMQIAMLKQYIVQQYCELNPDQHRNNQSFRLQLGVIWT